MMNNTLRQIIRHRFAELSFFKMRMQHYKGPCPLKVFITGPPRSGTSFLAGLVARMGLSPGPEAWLNKADEHNKYGYYECLPILKVEEEILKQLGGSYEDLPHFNRNWTANFTKEKNRIRKVVVCGGVEAYKGNRLLVLADLFHELFPEAKWIMMCRSEQDTYRSEWGQVLPPSRWAEVRQKRFDRWHQSLASWHCLNMRYEDFHRDKLEATRRVAEFIGVSLGDQELGKCADFFMPSAKSHPV